jgi:uncharacterized protein GlcG (DUF336 family)
MRLTSAQADALLRAAKSKADEIGVAASIAVLDFAGHLKAFCRMDGAWLGSMDVAMRKARTSVLFEMETESVWDIREPDAQAHGLEQTNGGLVTFAGGFRSEGRTAASSARSQVSGGAVAQDFKISRAGALALRE